MKKIVALVLTVVLLAACAAVFAEEAETAKKIVGVWYANQAVVDGIAYDISQVPEQSIVEFNEDGTGYLYNKNDQDNKTNMAWTEMDGKILMQDEDSQTTMNVSIIEDEGETYLVIGDESTNYVLNRTPAEAVNFAKTVKAEKAEDFDGRYALTYLSGDGYTLPAEKALDDLATLGVKTTEISIDGGLVELFGNEPRAYVFSDEDGTLNMEVDERVNFMNVYIFKTENGGLAINWMDLTFYADPVA